MKKQKDLLLVIDMQNVYLPEKPWACPSMPKTVHNIRKLLDSGEIEQVIFTRFVPPAAPEGTWKDYNIENDEINKDVYLNEMVEELKPYLQELPLYDKSVYSSFGIEELKEAAGQADRIILTGVVAECCVLATMMDAIDAGHRVIYLTDCVSGQSDQNEACIRKIAESFSPVHTMVMDSDTYLRQIRGEDAKNGGE